VVKQNICSSMGLGWHPIYEMEKKTCLKPPTSDCQSFKCTKSGSSVWGFLTNLWLRICLWISCPIWPIKTNDTPGIPGSQLLHWILLSSGIMRVPTLVLWRIPYFRTPLCDVEVSQTLESTAAAEKLVTCLCKMQNLERLPHHLVPGSWHFLGVYVCTWSPCLLATGDHECKRAIITALHLLWNVHSITFVLWFFWYSAVNKPNNPNTHSNIFTLIPSPIHIQHPPKCFQTYAFIPYIQGSLIFLWGIWWF